MHAGASAGYYGFIVTMDVYDFSLTNEQANLALVHIFNAGDGAPTSRTSIQISWAVSLLVTIDPLYVILSLYNYIRFFN